MSQLQRDIIAYYSRGEDNSRLVHKPLAKTGDPFAQRAWYISSNSPGAKPKVLDPQSFYRSRALLVKKGYLERIAQVWQGPDEDSFEIPTLKHGPNSYTKRAKHITKKELEHDYHPCYVQLSYRLTQKAIDEFLGGDPSLCLPAPEENEIRRKVETEVRKKWKLPLVNRAARRDEAMRELRMAEACVDR